MTELSESIQGCGDHSCIIRKPKGQGTNTHCTCIHRHMTTRDIRDVKGFIHWQSQRIKELEEENKTLRTAFSANETDNAEYLERIAELEKTCEEWCDAKSLDESALDLQEQLSRCLTEKAELEKFIVTVRDELLYPLSLSDSEFSVIAECLGQNIPALLDKAKKENKI